MQAKPFTVMFITDTKTKRRLYSTEKAARRQASKSIQQGEAIYCTLIHRGVGIQITE